MSLVVHHGPHLGPLGDALAELLGDPLEDPFQPEVIAVPTAGVRDWLQRHLAMRLGATTDADGVVANVQMPFPGRFVAAALGLPPDQPDPWDVDRLTWAVLTVLGGGAHDVPGSRLPRSVTARRIADLFDRYSTNRPEIIQQWAAGRDGDGTLDQNDAVVPLPASQVWQPRLWRAVREVVGVPSRAERLPQLLVALSSGACVPALPQRVAVFGVSGLAPGQLQVVDALAAVRDVHVHLVHPSSGAWAGERRRLGPSLTPRAAVDAAAGVEHPLLRAWARPSLEAAMLVRASTGTLVAHPHPTLEPAPVGQLQLALDGSAVANPPRGETTLHRLQADVLADRRPEQADLAADDGSLQVHACHGATRQLEVLRDALAHLFAHDPTLQPNDVLVVCPDLARFAPLASAVFERGSFPVPLRVTDLTLGSQNVVASALVAALGLLAGRAAAADVLAFCGLDPVRVRFGISLDDLELYDKWVAELGTTWGLDAAHRSDWLSVDVADGTWASTVARVLVGAAMPAPEPRIGVGGIVPFDDVDAGGFEAAGKLADLLARLRTAREDAQRARPIAEWCDRLVALVDSLFSSGPREAWQSAEVLHAIDELRERSLVAGATSSVPLTLTDVRALLAATIGSPTGRLDLRSGAVTMTTMVPVRNLPARVICIAGLDEGSIRSGSVDGDDVLGMRPCVGERDPRAEGRHLLLDALLAAEEHVIVTFDGNDITTNRPLPLPIHVAELLAAAPTGRPPERRVVRHPRRAHDPRNFMSEGLAGAPGPFSFDLSRREGARASRDRRADERWRALPALVPSVVTITELAEAGARPARIHLRDRLDVRIPRERDALDPHIPIGVAPLERYALGDDLLRRHQREGFGVGSPAPATWRTMQRLQGTLPPRALADAVLDDVGAELAAILDSRPSLRTQLDTATRVVDVDLSIALPAWAGKGTVSIRDRIEPISGSTLVRVAFVRPKARGRLSAAIALAALVASHPGEFWQVLLATRAESAAGKPYVMALLPAAPHDADAARRFLEIAVDLHLRALREPIPLFEFSPGVAETRTLEDEVVEWQISDDPDVFVWGGLTAADLLAVRPVEGDPRIDVCPRGSDQPSRLVSYAVHLWSAFTDFVSEQKATA